MKNQVFNFPNWSLGQFRTLITWNSAVVVLQALTFVFCEIRCCDTLSLRLGLSQDVVYDDALFALCTLQLYAQCTNSKSSQKTT